MDIVNLLLVLDCLEDGQIRYWIGGGWGIDALARRQTREHADLDLAVSDEDMDRALDLLSQAGYEIHHDQDWRPARVAVRDTQRHQVDLHPLRIDRHGSGLQANLPGLSPFEYPLEDLVRGVIGGKSVPCISVPLQIRFHSGYPPSHKDMADLAVLEQLQRRCVDREQ